MKLLEIMGAIADTIGIAGALFSLWAWQNTKQIKEHQKQERKRLAQRIRIVLNYGERNIELPIGLQRSELTRAEIFGRIGMIPMKTAGQRFSLLYLNTPEFLEQLEQIREGTTKSVFTIPCTEAEIEQFQI